MFCLHPSAQSSASGSQLRLGVTGHDRLIADAQNDVDVALKTLVGDGAEDAGADAVSTKQKLLQSRTILSFETVDDDDGGMDWNRSKRLAEDLRDAIANGKRPVLPLLKCAQSPSPSPKM